MKLKKVTALVIIAATICCILFGCGQNKLLGTWIPFDGSGRSGYPDMLVLRDKDSGSADGIEVSWYTEGDTLHLFIERYGEYTYDYKVSGDKLYLDDELYIRR